MCRRRPTFILLFPYFDEALPLPTSKELLDICQMHWLPKNQQASNTTGICHQKFNLSKVSKCKFYSPAHLSRSRFCFRSCPFVCHFVSIVYWTVFLSPLSLTEAAECEFIIVNVSAICILTQPANKVCQSEASVLPLFCFIFEALSLIRKGEKGTKSNY